MSADCASVAGPRHEAYARVQVLAYWRLMPTEKHRQLYGDAVSQGKVMAVHELCLGSTQLHRPHVPAGFPWAARFLGCADLVGKFDTSPTRWGMALMEMLIDPVLAGWVPGWVVEQYERMNPHFRSALRAVLRRADPAWRASRKASGRQPPATPRNNVELLEATRRLMQRREENAAEKDAVAAGPDLGGAGGRGRR